MTDIVDLDAKKRASLMIQRAQGLLASGDVQEAYKVLGESLRENAGHGAAPPVALEDLIDAAIAQAERRASGEDKPVATPWRHMNDTLGGGLWPGAHFLVAGTAVGKSQLSFQIARHAAKAGVPVGLIALELDPLQMVMRLAAEEANSRIDNRKDRVRWSSVYNGKASAMHLQMVKQAARDIGKMPILTDFGQAMGWPASRLEFVVRALRNRYPDGPALLVLDFVQLVASEEGPNTRPTDLRERIGRAGYIARNLGREHGVSIIIVSSTARENYARLSGPLSKMGLHVEGGRRICTMPDQLIGLGKESGELEYAADSVNVLLQPRTTAGACDPEIDAIKTEERGKVVVCASVKVRAGQPSWFALKFVDGSFSEIREQSMNSLCGTEDEADGKAGRPKRDPQSYVLEVVQAVQKAELDGKALANATAVTEHVVGNDRQVRDAVKLAMRDGFIFKMGDQLLFRKMPADAPEDDSDVKSELF